VDPVPDPVLRKSGSPGNRTLTPDTESNRIVKWTPFQNLYFSEILVAREIEPGTVYLQPGTLITRPQAVGHRDTREETLSRSCNRRKRRWDSKSDYSGSFLSHLFFTSDESSILHPLPPGLVLFRVTESSAVRSKHQAIETDGLLQSEFPLIPDFDTM
jgi:hypothetical protein